MSQAIQPDQAIFVLNALSLPALEREHRTTRCVIEAIPTSQWDYRPDPNARSAVELAWHIVAAEKRFLEGVANGEFNFNPIHRPDTVQSSAEIGCWYGEMFQSVYVRLQKLSGEQLMKPIDFRGMFTQPAVLYCTLTLNHSIHHRGQLSTYLRPMGARVPAIYGESYDSAEARKASQAKTA
jgi:uncharacterized damage-inducible protein DinB